MASELYIIGLGHIGASLACRMSKKGYQVHGTDLVPSRVTYCARKHWIKPVAELPGEGICVVAVPESAALSKFVLHRLALLPKGWTVTEVFSSKSATTASLQRYCEKLGLKFAWSHPLAGREGRGPESCDPSIFNGATVLIDRASIGRKDGRAAVEIANLWRDAGCRPEFVSTESHQESLAWGSHLTHVMAYALAKTAAKKARVSPSLLGAVRVASSDPKSWAGILFSNRKAVTVAVAAFQKELAVFAKAVKSGSAREIERKLSEGHRSARLLAKQSKGRTA